MDPELRWFLHLCGYVIPFAIVFLLILVVALCRIASDADERLGYKEDEQ